MNTVTRRLVLVAVSLGGVVLSAVAIVMPSLEYDPRVEAILDRSAGSPAQAAQGFLLRLGHLPRPGGSGCVEDDGAHDGEVVPQPTEQIQDVTVQRVRLIAEAPILAAILDDDPTCRAVIDLQVTTVDGQTTPLSVELWDYGLLTPWAFHSRGDGLKLVRVCWEGSIRP